ncbi:hypothetical protein ACFS27_19095 [Promicromonospora vindobonensis]|uniref:Uncharacterized protein n=1 Tax=Promicromonospora vindobonensis TaxID=195748 RepID=A0ABW5VWR3_9MICO
MRFPDPEGRSDEAGRVIPHDIVALPPLADDIRSVDDGQRIVWPLIADIFARLWDRDRPPSATDIRRAIGENPPGLDTDEGFRA